MSPFRRAGGVVLATPLATLLACAGAGPTLSTSREASGSGECGTCHAEIVDEWARSAHRLPGEGSFLRAFAAEPLPMCLPCHAPASRRDLPAGVGAGCSHCHARPHEETPEAVASTCAGCHELAFAGPSPSLMQSTMSEHAASGVGDVACASCHMPRTGPPGGAHASHVFRGSRDEAWVRGAVDVDASRTAEGLRLVFRRRGAGHAFPTGDAFRRLRVTARREGPDHAVFEERTVFLERHTQLTSQGTMIWRAATLDDRPLSTGTATVVDVPLDPAGGTIGWSVVYERVLSPGRGDEDAVLDGAPIAIAHGRIEP